MVLYTPEEPYLGLVEAVVSSLGDATLLWEMNTFLHTPPPPYTVLTTTHHHAHGSFCVAYVILARLQDVGRVTMTIQRSKWFQDANKMLLVYTGSALPLSTLTQQNFLGSGYGTVIASWLPWEKSVLRNTGQVFYNDLVYHLVSSFPCSTGGPQMALVDVWVPGVGQVWNNPLYTDKFKNFHGHTFTVVTMNYAPFTFYEVKSGVVHLKDCVDARILRVISSVLNFTYIIREPPDGQWGLRLDNGSYTGVIGELQKYTADFSLNLAITGERGEVVDYTVGYFNDPLTFCTSKPRPLSQALALIRPFQPLMWMGITGALMLMCVMYYITCQVTGQNTSTSYSLVLLKIFGASLSQGCEWSVGNGPRLLVATWIIFSMVTLTSYIAMLTASFTLPKLSPTLNSLEDLVQSDLAWGIQQHEAADYQLLKLSEVPLYQKVYKGLKVCPSLDDCLIRARDTKYAFIAWRLYMEDRIAIRFTSVTGEQKLHIATNNFFPSDIGWAFNAGCPYRSKFNQQIRRLLEAGLISKWISQIMKDPKRREEVDTKKMPALEGTQPITLAQLAGAFYILVIGNIIALLLFLVELCKT
ncbi:probable glutamate receptor isoform X3 [Cherax quadricarinatus]